MGSSMVALHGGGSGDGIWPAVMDSLLTPAWGDSGDGVWLVVMGPHLHFCSGHSKKMLDEIFT